MSDQKEICEGCGKQVLLQEKLVTVYRQWGEKYFIFERVPAEVCPECGYRYYSLVVVQEMERLMTAPETQAYAQPVPVVPFG
jgi:YgiT-type zinc finger domain-containing protein